MELSFVGELWFWRGPAPWHFVTVPEPECEELKFVSASVTYGWGMIPVVTRVGHSRWTTSLFPKDGRYILPVKLWVRTAEGLDLGDSVSVCLTI